MLARQHEAGRRARPAPTTLVSRFAAAVFEESPASTSGASPDLTKDLARSINKTATTFAPRSSTAKGKNPAQKGTLLYDIFEWQAWLSLVRATLAACMQPQIQRRCMRRRRGAAQLGSQQGGLHCSGTELV